jgi:hypothetical protein
MSSAEVNAGGRLDRLPIARFHYRVFSLQAIIVALLGVETIPRIAGLGLLQVNHR